MNDPVAFAEDWIASWNAHDLDRILSHYTEDFEMSSPYIVQFTGEASGTLKGKDKIGAYWRAALQRLPDLRFEHIATCAGIGSVAIHYKGAGGRLVIEVFQFGSSGLVEKAAAHYG